jgi:hypothetical protein
MFGLTKREQRWAAEQKAAEVLIPAITEIVVERLKMDTNDRIAALEAENAELRVLESEAAARHRETLAELAKVREERDAYMLLSKMRPAPQADMVPAEELAAAQAERDAAFEMSRCECGTDEACANLARLHKERDAAVEDAERLRFLLSAPGDMTLRLHNTRPDLRLAMIDAAIDAARKEGK